MSRGPGGAAAPGARLPGGDPDGRTRGMEKVRLTSLSHGAG